MATLLTLVGSETYILLKRLLSPQWGSGTWYPLDVAPGEETEHIIAQACKMAGKTSTPMQIMCYEKK